MHPPRIGAGVAFDRDVLDYLRLVCAEQRRDRSFVINAIVREHAAQKLSRSSKPERAIHF